MMKLLTRTIILGLMLGSISVIGMGKENKKHVTFDDPVVVNGTTVKAGTYEVVFDDQTNQLTIFKGKKALATAPARLEKLEKDIRQVYTVWSASSTGDEPKVLTSVRLKDGYQAKLNNPTDMKTESSN